MSATKLHSPWLEHIERTRPLARLTHDLHADVAVVGAGIAGVSTAYFLLKHTWKRVALIEGDRVAHGATGHNAGQLVSYFERPFHDIVSEFGLELAADGQRAVEASWDLLEEMRRDLKLETPITTFTGHAGIVDENELLMRLRDNEQRAKAGLPLEALAVADTFVKRHRLASKYRKLYSVIAHDEILNALQTKDRHYVAMLSSKKGCANSARFCEEAVTAMLKRHPRRLTVAEHAPISTVRLYGNSAELDSGKHVIRAKRVVLCTNGFERLYIENHAGSNIDVKFHHLVRGSVGYMAAFVETPPAQPTAVSFLPSHLEASSAYDSDPYFYLTRRPHGRTQDLLCVGGPEALMDDTNNYSREHPYPEEAKKMIDRFVKKTYRHAGRSLKYTHLWHGLMGYTPNGIRCVGAEPCNPVLMYNLGCNGVGLLPSIMGGHRIAQIIKGKRIAPSIFDPADRRCIIPEQRTEEDVIASDKWFARHTVWGFATFWTLAIIAVLATYWAKKSDLFLTATQIGT